MVEHDVTTSSPEQVVIKIAEYDPAWVAQFAAHEAKIMQALGPRALQVEHIGSTSVPGLAAKPIIDILIVVADSADESTYLDALISAGYELRWREPDFFEHRMVRTPERDTHVHIYSTGCGEIERYLLLRNHLRKHAEARNEYARIKRGLAKQSWATMNDYANAKTEIIERLIRTARGTSHSAA